MTDAELIRMFRNDPTWMGRDIADRIEALIKERDEAEQRGYANAMEAERKLHEGRIEEDRAATADLSIADRFARVMAEFRQMTPQYRMIGEVRQPNGDRGHCFFMAEYAGGVSLDNVEVADARAKWQQGESDKDHMARFCDMLEADFARRQQEAAA